MRTHISLQGTLNQLCYGEDQGNKGHGEVKCVVTRTPWLHRFSRQGGCHICESNCDGVQRLNGS